MVKLSSEILQQYALFCAFLPENAAFILTAQHYESFLNGIHPHFTG